MNGLNEKSLLKAIGFSVALKSIGASFRAFYDERNAPADVRKKTFIREGLTLAQIAVYSLAIKATTAGLFDFVDVLDKKNKTNTQCEEFYNAWKAQKPRSAINRYIIKSLLSDEKFSFVFKKLAVIGKNKQAFHFGITAAAYVLAEGVSRIFAPRDYKSLTEPTITIKPGLDPSSITTVSHFNLSPSAMQPQQKAFSAISPSPTLASMQGTGRTMIGQLPPRNNAQAAFQTPFKQQATPFSGQSFGYTPAYGARQPFQSVI
ncbi:MAG: hypothetical protein AAGI66_05505 [Cyanobacteria bacterium P01_H01_bin.74]